MITTSPPKYVKHTLMKLESKGYRAFLVGGCVRDMILNKRPNDWDVCTNALPVEILAAFPGSLPTGIEHGTVTVVSGKHRLEVTTFRSESDYTDHRRPDTVSFVSDLSLDLRRRDFTINAIALPSSGFLVDPFGGMEDIRSRLIRCIGNPAERFTEDALRMFRALRFSAQLGFDIEEETSAAIHECAHLSSFISAPRIREEAEKILMSPRPEILGRLFSYGLLDEYITRPRATAGLWRMSSLPVNKAQRWAGLCAAAEKNGLITGTESFLRALRLDSNTISACVTGVSSALSGDIPSNKPEWKYYLSRRGTAAASCCAAAADMLLPGNSCKALKSVLASGECFSLGRLAVNGDDLMALGYSGRDIGDVLDALLLHVISNPRENNRERLLSLLESGLP